MAEKRMFSKKITDADAFIEMSSAAQALYFHLNQSADDDGFNNQVQIAMMKAHASVDDLRVLMAKNFIIRFENGVIVIKHWRMHNTLRLDRYTPTSFQDELAMLNIKPNLSYTLIDDGCQTVAKRLPNGCPSIDKIRIDKIRLEEDSITARARDGDDDLIGDEVETPVTERVHIADWQTIADDFNRICKHLPKIKSPMADDRKKTVKARLSEYPDISLTAVFERVEKSDFLTGQTSKPWNGCSFDWIFNKSNFRKIVEGNYDNKAGAVKIGPNNVPYVEDHSDPELDAIFGVGGVTYADYIKDHPNGG